jgi:hypothetical protein
MLVYGRSLPGRAPWGYIGVAKGNSLMEQTRPAHWFKPGQTGNPFGRGVRKHRRSEIERSLLQELGDVELTAVDLAMVARAADLLASRPTSHNHAVRTVNAASRLIERLREKYAPPKRAVDELLEVGLR